jgi:hypothetical protein
MTVKALTVEAWLIFNIETSFNDPLSNHPSLHNFPERIYHEAPIEAGQECCVT